MADESLRNRLARYIYSPTEDVEDEEHPMTKSRTWGNRSNTWSGILGQSGRSRKRLKQYWKVYKGDGTVFASINATALNVCMTGYSLDANDEDALREVREFLSNINFEGILYDAVVDSLIFGDSFIEIINSKTTGDPVNLKSVNPQTMEIEQDKYNRIQSYHQILNGKGQPDIKPSKIIQTGLTKEIPGEPYHLSLIEPSMGMIKRKVEADDAIAAAITRHGFAKWHIKVNTEGETGVKGERMPDESDLNSLQNKFEDLSGKNEIVTTDFIDVSPLDSSGVENVEEYFNYFLAQLVTGLLCPEEALGHGGGPLTPDTEIFVKGKGFTPIPKVKVGDEIMTLNPETNELELQPNLKNWKSPINEDIYHYNAQTFDLKCTGNHRFWHRGQHKEHFDTKLAEDLPTRFETQVGGFNWNGTDKEFITIPSVDLYVGNRWTGGKIKVATEGEKKIPIDTWLEFLGYFLSEGYTTYDEGQSYVVGIRQYPGSKYNKIKKCMEKLPFKVGIHDTRFTISSKQLTTYLRKFGKSHEKHIPNYVKELPPHRLKIIYDALMLGDGCQNNYFTSSKQLANDVQEIILKMGYGSTIYIRDRIGEEVIINDNLHGKYNYLQYTVTKNEKNLTPEVCIKDTKGHKSILEKEKYDGMVHCVTVDNGLILVRRNGKCMITGNSTEATSKIRMILWGRLIKTYQHNLSKCIENQLFDKITGKPGAVKIKFKGTTESDEARHAEWASKLLQGLSDAIDTYEDKDELPMDANEMRTLIRSILADVVSSEDFMLEKLGEDYEKNKADSSL